MDRLKTKNEKYPLSKHKGYHLIEPGTNKHSLYVF